MTTEQFHYTYEGEEIVLPHLKNLPTGILRKVRNKEALDAAFSIFESLCDDQALAVIDAMPLEEFQSFQVAWEKASGTSLGESSASSPS